MRTRLTPHWGFQSNYLIAAIDATFDCPPNRRPLSEVPVHIPTDATYSGASGQALACKSAMRSC